MVFRDQDFKYALSYLDITYTVVGGRKFTKDGKYIFVGNHPLGGADSLIVGEIIVQHYGVTTFVLFLIA